MGRKEGARQKHKNIKHFIMPNHVHGIIIINDPQNIAAMVLSEYVVSMVGVKNVLCIVYYVWRIVYRRDARSCVSTPLHHYHHYHHSHNPRTINLVLNPKIWHQLLGDIIERCRANNSLLKSGNTEHGFSCP